MTRNFKLELSGETILEIKASGDDNVVNYFFDKILGDSFGVLYELRKAITKKAKDIIIPPVTEEK